MIDGRKLYKWIKAQINPYGKPFEGTVFEFGNKVMEHIEAMENQPQTDKWIPCSERLPSKENEEYFICTKNQITMCCLWTKRGWNTHINENGTYYTECELKNVVAWQPLPQPYKKEGTTDDE